MSVYRQLKAYAEQLTGDKEIASIIVDEVSTIGIGVLMDTRSAIAAHAFMITTIRNKCYNYNRWRETPEADAAILGVSIGEVDQVKRALVEGRFR